MMNKTAKPITNNGSRPMGITLAAALMIIFGLAEVVTGFTHNFFGLSTAQVSISTIVGVAIGLFYLVAGLLILSMKKTAAALAILLLIADVIGRVAMVIAGLYPTDSPKQTVAIILGTAIAALFALFIGWRWKSFN
jgi:hypothetical protein